MRLTGARTGGNDDRELGHGVLVGSFFTQPLLQSRVLGDRHHPAAGDRRRRHRARHRRPRPEHRARLALRRAAAPGARPHRLLLHRPQLPPRLTAPAQDHGADGRGRRRVVSPGAGGQHGVHGGRRQRPRRHARRADPAVGRTEGGVAPLPADTVDIYTAGAAEVPRPARGDGDGREVHPPDVPHLGAGRADRQGQDDPARPHEGRRQGPHPLRLAELHQLQEGRAQASSPPPAPSSCPATSACRSSTTATT